MAETPLPLPLPSLPPSQPRPSQPPSPPNPISTAEYWCYQCEKCIAVDPQSDHPDVICSECKRGFVESISLTDLMDDEIPPLSNEIIQITIASPNEYNQDLPLPEESDENNNNHHVHNIDDHDQNCNEENRDREGSDDENEEEEEEEEEEDELRQRQRRHNLRLRLHDNGLSTGRHDRILDWAELLLQLEDQSVTFGEQRLEFEDAGDYVDATGYDSFLQTLAESDSSNKRGAPPASKLAVEALETVEVISAISTEFCAVCKDGMFCDEEKIVKQLPCGHMYHGVCIMTWLESRNTCPICRHELPTNDLEYEEDRKQRLMVVASDIDHGCSSSSGSGV